MKQLTLVDVRSTLNLVATIIRWFSLVYLLPVGTAIFYREDVLPFMIPLVLSAALGWMGVRLTRSPRVVGIREGFLVVALTWLVVVAFGALPYLWYNLSFIDAFFEAMSGFTTTGSSILTDIEGQAMSLLMWRQFTCFLGGMGIIVLAVAILPKLAVGGRQLMEAEAPGVKPSVEQLTPRIYQTAQALWKIYLGLVVSETLLLKALGLSLFDSMGHAFATIATAGFSPKALGLAAYSPAAQWVVFLFMVLGGTNFVLMYRVLTGRISLAWRDSEFRFYLWVILASGLLLALLLGDLPWEERLRHGLFQASSIMTTTGFASIDYEQWSDTLKMILLMLMFFGGCAGSTAGSIKIVRALLVFKFLYRELRTVIHPNAVVPVRLGKRVIPENVLRGVMAFSILYITTFAFASVLLLLDAGRVGLPLSVLEAAGAAATTMGNIGPGFGFAGPMGSFASFPDTSKLLLTFLMWAGRLELFPVLVLLMREYWKR